MCTKIGITKRLLSVLIVLMMSTHSFSQSQPNVSMSVEPREYGMVFCLTISGAPGSCFWPLISFGTIDGVTVAPHDGLLYLDLNGPWLGLSHLEVDSSGSMSMCDLVVADDKASFKAVVQAVAFDNGDCAGVGTFTNQVAFSAGYVQSTLGELWSGATYCDSSEQYDVFAVGLPNETVEVYRVELDEKGQVQSTEPVDAGVLDLSGSLHLSGDVSLDSDSELHVFIAGILICEVMC